MSDQPGTQHIDRWLDDWLAGRLDDAQSADIRRHLADCRRCRRRARRAHRIFGQLTRALDPVAPPAGLRQRVMDDLVTGGRFMGFAQQVAELIDVGVEHARDLLAGIDYPANWTNGPGEGVDIYHIDGGPKTAEAIVGFIRIEAGHTFPHHRHLGKERVFVLQGSFRDPHGQRHGPGDLVVEEPDTGHELDADDGPPLIYLVVIDEGLEIFGLEIGPESPLL